MDRNKKNSAIEKALKEAEEIFGQPVTFKVRDADGNLVEATEEDIIKVESGKQISEPQESFKLSVTADVDGSKTTFSRKKDSEVVYEESYYFSNPKEPNEPKSRFEDIKDSENSQEIEKLEREVAEKEKALRDAKKKLEKAGQKGDEVFTQHHQILPKK